MTDGWTKPRGTSPTRRLVSTSKPEKLYIQCADGIHRSPWNGLKRAKQGLIWIHGLGLKSRIAQIRYLPFGTSHPLHSMPAEYTRLTTISPNPEVSLLVLIEMALNELGLFFEAIFDGAVRGRVFSSISVLRYSALLHSCECE
jgi:hypothetical protein